MSVAASRALLAAGLLLIAAGSGACSTSTDTASEEETTAPTLQAPETIRIAVFNVEELSTQKITQIDDSGVGTNPQVRAAAQIIQRVRPDILVLNDLDHNGVAAGDEELGDRAFGDDSFGFGLYPGQYSMAVLSRFPILTEQARTFQKFLWKDLPDNHVPEGYFSPEALEIFRLSSKSHWDVPVRVGDNTLHLFVSHPTPPVFDGDEDKNGRRNFDEIKFWVEYLHDGQALYDDTGGHGGFNSSAPFIILGDLNAYPDSPEGIYDDLPAIAQLLSHPRTQDTGGLATSRGALQQRGDYPGGESGPPRFLERATASWAGGVRVDYVLPSSNLIARTGGVFWPSAEEDAKGLALAEQASDHHLVWIDVSFEGQ